MKKWFVTWDRSEYKEWARETPKGYVLLIIRNEKNRSLCVKADLTMGEKGLPSVNIVEQKYFPSEKKASKQIKNWMRE